MWAAPWVPPVPDARHLLKKNRIRSLCTAWAGCFQKGLPFRAGPFRALLSSAATCWLAEYLLPTQMSPITARSWLAPVPGVLKGSHSAAVQSRARREILALRPPLGPSFPWTSWQSTAVPFSGAAVAGRGILCSYPLLREETNT